MKTRLSPIITAKEFNQLIKNEDMMIIDAGAGNSARNRYKNEHIEGALYIDLNEDLAEIPENAANGGRHPLPQIEKFSLLLGNLGISKQSNVVVYDDKQGSNAAARFWWMLRAAGHHNIQVLSGGLQSAKRAGITINDKPATPKPVPPYPFSCWQLPTKNIVEVAKASADKNYLIIDVRNSERYLGISEPLDPIAGHIPNAINLPFKNHLDTNGEFLKPEEIIALYRAPLKNFKSENILVHCGSGVTACHTLLALTQAGFEIPALYVGSWSEWCRNT